MMSSMLCSVVTHEHDFNLRKEKKMKKGEAMKKDQKTRRSAENYS